MIDSSWSGGTEHIETACAAAQAAGEVLRQRWSLPRTINQKQAREIQTDADIAAQAAAIAVVTARYPEYQVLGEEDPRAVELSGPTPVWIIDPLDGTSNYAQHIPYFCVSVALAQGGKARLGAVYDPLRDELFYSARGGGAFMRVGNGAPRRLAVSRVAEVRAAMIGFDWPRSNEQRAEILRSLTGLVAQCRTARNLGSATLALTYVADGRLDGYFQRSLEAWDTAAALVLVAEAGGAVTTPACPGSGLCRGPVIASNGLLHDALLRATDAFSRT